METHKACKECVLNYNGCLLQENDDTESCEDVRKYELDHMQED